MLPKTNRLGKQKDVARLFKFGKFFKEEYIILRIAQNSVRKNRATVIISNKILKKATQRNQAKRFIRQEIDHFIRNKSKESGCDVVILVQKPFKKTDYLTIKKQLQNLLKKIN